jgi:anionic cell wall polymer biosynthesis LytR-Cps2A-Psr (LCP) family protein
MATRHGAAARALVALVFAALVGSTTALPVAAMVPPGPLAEGGLRSAVKATRQLATDASGTTRRGTASARSRRGQPLRLGRDGRLTVLVIGSDWRSKSGGERFDVVMVATIDPLTGRAAVVSIPRDMGGIPFAGGGSSGGMRVNSIYFIRYRDTSLPHARVDRRAVKRFSRDIGALLGTEIDYWVLARFKGFADVISHLGGVRLDVDQEVVDSSYHHYSSRGVWFPRTKRYRLLGNPPCKPKPRRCHSALVYVRSRKGTMGGRPNSDYRRAERQQDVVRAAVEQIRDGGTGLALLGTYLRVRDDVTTDLPTTPAAAAQLFEMVRRFRLAADDMKVLAPSTWAGLAADGTLRPDLRQIRRWVDRNFYRVRAPAEE